MDPDEIAAAALEIVDTQGADALTMRAVANALGVSPMGLYRHVANKSALIALVAERAQRERPLPATSSDDWRDDLYALAVWIRETIRAHPAVISLHTEDHSWTPSMLVLGEQWMNVWHRSSLDIESANRAAAASGTAIIGFVREEVARANCKPPEDTTLSWTPNMRAALEFREQSSQDRADFELLVRSLADGLCEALSRPGAANPSRIDST